MAVTLFETLELRHGRPFALRRHLARLTAAAAQLDVAAPGADELLDAVARVSAAWGTRPGRLRITWTAGIGPGDPRGTQLTVHAAPMTIRTDPVDVVLAVGVHDEHGATSGLKTAHGADRVAELRRAATLGAGEALFANRRGELCEGATSNVVVVLDGAACTPPLSSGCLPGVTRALLLEASSLAGLELVERSVPLEDLGRADEVALLSTARHLQPVRTIDGRAVPTTDHGAVSALREQFRDAYAHVDEP